MAKEKKKKTGNKSRRQFLRSFGLGAGMVGAALLGIIPVLTKWRKRLRPPGHLESEQEFLSACIKCGQCVQVCPVEAIVLGDIDDGYGVGAPYIEPRVQACDFSCDALQCILSCPTHALSPHLAELKEDVRIGEARFIGADRCLAMKGQGFTGLPREEGFAGLLRYEEVDRWKPIKIRDYSGYDLELCDLCMRECPIEGAITFEPVSDDPNDPRRKPKVHCSCTGCGVCVMICPTEESCFEIEPGVPRREGWRERRAKHHRGGGHGRHHHEQTDAAGQKGGQPI